MHSYPGYKPELRLPGIRQVPEHWDVLRNSVIFREVNETGYGELQLLSILADRGVVKQSETGRKERAPEDRSKYKRILRSDIGYNLMNAFMGAIGVSNYNGIISPAYAVCRPKIEIETEYFHYLFKTDLYLTEFDRNAYGIMDERNRLYFENFKRIYVTFPPLHEQKAIVKYINQKLAQIDQFISYKRRLIELLNEQKTVLINQAVTRGLDPNVSMKPSGIDWLGDIPAHWDLLPVKHLCLRIVDCKNRTPIYCENGKYPVVRTSNVRNGELIKEDLYTTDESNYAEWTKRGAPIPGDVLFTREAPAGEACLVPDNIKLCMGQRMMYFRPDSSLLSSKFLLYSIYGSSVIEYIQRTCSGSTVEHLRVGQVHNLPVLVPPRDEQNAIVCFIERESQVIHHAISQAEKEIELIQEYRTTLISDAVTGKIDVRDRLETGVAVAAGGVK